MFFSRGLARFWKEGFAKNWADKSIFLRFWSLITSRSHPEQLSDPQNCAWFMRRLLNRLRTLNAWRHHGSPNVFECIRSYMYTRVANLHIHSFTLGFSTLMLSSTESDSRLTVAVLRYISSALFSELFGSIITWTATTGATKRIQYEATILLGDDRAVV